MDGKLRRRICLLLLLAGMLAVTPGCVGLLAQMMYVMKGARVKPEFNGLKRQKVALVCISDTSLYGPDYATEILDRKVRDRLSREVKRIDLVPSRDIKAWIDNHNPDEIDYLEIGKGVDADVVLAVELQGYSVQAGSTLNQGSTTYSLQVYDLRSESPSVAVFSKGPIDFSFPTNGPLPTINMSQRKFEEQMMLELGTQITNPFCGYELRGDVARDAQFQ